MLDMNPDEQIKELTALLQQERVYALTLKTDNSELKALQRHLVSGLDVWKAGFEKLYHEHHVTTGTNLSSECSICLRENEFELSELVPHGDVPSN